MDHRQPSQVPPHAGDAVARLAVVDQVQIGRHARDPRRDLDGHSVDRSAGGTNAELAGQPCLERLTGWQCLGIGRGICRWQQIRVQVRLDGHRAIAHVHEGPTTA